MHLVIWTFAVLLLSSCVHADDQICKTNEDKCSDDVGCKTTERDGKCNIAQSYCCEFGGAPPTQCVPDECTGDDTCTQHGTLFYCNIVNGHCCVNAITAQSQCLKEKHNVEVEQRSLMSIGKNKQDMVDIRCSSTGGYVAKCKGNVCFCLNAATGAKVDSTQHGVTIDTIDCESTQRKTNVERLRLSIKVSSKALSEISESKQTQMMRKLKSKAEETTVSVRAIELKSGSVICDMELESYTAETSDLASLSAVVITEITDWKFVVDGETFQCTDVAVIHITTTEMLYGPVTTALPPPAKKDEKTTIVSVFVIFAAIVMLLATGMICYICILCF